VDPKDYVVKSLQDGSLKMSCEDPDHPDNWPRVMFVWRSNILGSSGKGHEYFLRHLLGATHGVQGKALGDEYAKPEEVKWHAKAPEGKLDLLVTLDFRMSTTCLYSDIVLPTATWYEKNDLNTSDMHPFIHPLSTAVDPAWQSRSDWEIYKGFAKKFSEVCAGHLGVEKELVLTPLMHDTPAELAQPFDVKDWKRGEIELIPANRTADRRDRARLPERAQALHRPRPADEQDGQRRQGHRLEHADEVRQPGELNGLAEGRDRGMPRIETDIDACEVVLMLAPETNGHVAVKAWAALGKQTGREHTHSAHREDEKIASATSRRSRARSSARRPGAVSSPRPFRTRRLHQCARADPWRTLTGRQQFYQDHPWMQPWRDAGSYRPPVDLKGNRGHPRLRPNGNPEILLNSPAPEVGHTLDYTDNLMMLTLPWRADRLVERRRREARRHSRQRLG
jgi:nitrate reductase alpha subunit